MLKFKQQWNGMGTDIKKATTQTKIKQNGDEKPDEFEINNWWADLNVKENETFNRILRLAFDSQNSKKKYVKKIPKQPECTQSKPKYSHICNQCAFVGLAFCNVVSLSLVVYFKESTGHERNVQCTKLIYAFNQHTCTYELVVARLWYIAVLHISHNKL